jgi:predicted 2-oxoglutarate/Fe(II)-dependent dioxygenase YbiX
MQANKLSWKTQQLARWTYPFVYWDNFLSDGELKDIEDWCLAQGVTDSMTIGSGDQGNMTEARKSKSRIHNFDFNNLWIFEKLRIMSEHVNTEFFNFDLLGFDYFQYAEYQGEGSHYDYHTDLIYGHDLPSYMVYPRKLSFSLILSDSSEYTGGEFQFITDTSFPVTVEQRKGRLIAFPSWVLHRVAPLKSGIRKSIVWWVTGPKFK